MRERTTWDRNQIRQAATQRKADPTLMNQNHVQQQPGATDYTTGTPSTFGEDVDKTNRWEDEYKGGQVARNELGMPEFRAETFNHPEKTAALDEETLIKKANLCVRVASLMLRKTATEAAIEDQAAALMNLPDYDLIETYTRLADEQQGQGQAKEEEKKEAGEMPPQFKENAEKKKEEAEAKKDDGEKKEAEAQVQTQQVQQAQQQQVSQQDVQAQIQQAVAQAIQQMQAQQQAQAQQCPQACGKMAEDEKKDDQGQQVQAQQQEGQEQQVQAQQQQVSQDQIAQMVQQAVQQALQAQQQVQTQQQVPPAQQQVQTQQQQQVSQIGDIELNPEPVADDLGIELEAPIMDTGDVTLGPEDDVLMSLFANDEAQAQEQIQQGDQGQQRQASVRTASTRTVGTRPTGGVSRIGGSGAPAAKTGSDVDRMSALWASAPDVSEAFGLTKR